MFSSLKSFIIQLVFLQMAAGVLEPIPVVSLFKINNNNLNAHPIPCFDMCHNGRLCVKKQLMD